MQASALLSFGLLSLAAFAGCRTDDGTTQDAGGTTDAPVTAEASAEAALPTDASSDGSPRPDASSNPDSATPGPDGGGMDASSVPVMVTLAQLSNPMASGHPASRARVVLSDTLVALSPRLFISQSNTTMKCLFAAWVGTSAGGDFAAVEVFEDLPAPPSGMDCFAATEVGNIPASLAIGDTLGTVAGTYDAYCPSGSTCPAGVAAELDVSTGARGMFSVTGHGGAVPSPASVTPAEVSALGATAAPRDLALQNGLVRLTGALLRVPPAGANHNVMQVSVGTAATPTMAVDVTRYAGVSCQRAILAAMAAGAAVGDVTGVLVYSFGQWVVQPRQAADLPGITCPDAGAGTDAGASDAPTGG